MRVIPTAEGHTQAREQLLSGIDALYLSARTTLRPAFPHRLEDRRRWADRARLPVPCEIGPEVAAMAPHAWGRYRYCLEHPMARIGLTTSKHVPTVRVQPRAEALHSLGPAETVAFVSALLEPELGRLHWQVSRVDLFCDFQGWVPTVADNSHFVCRAETRRMSEVAGHLTGFTFGSRTTKTLCARLYDKTADIEAKVTTRWHEVWGDAYRATEPVWRLEFEVAREGLNQFGLATPEEVLAGAGDLWAYAAGDWLTLREPQPHDATRSRWPLAPEWRQLQRADLVQRRTGAARVAAARQASSVDRLLPGLTGYLSSFATVVGTEDIDDAVVVAVPHLRDYEAVTRTPFAERVERKRVGLRP